MAIRARHRERHVHTPYIHCGWLTSLALGASNQCTLELMHFRITGTSPEFLSRNILWQLVSVHRRSKTLGGGGGGGGMDKEWLCLGFILVGGYAPVNVFEASSL